MKRARSAALALSVALVVSVAGKPAAAAGAILPGGGAKDPYTVDAGKLDYFEKELKLVYSGDVIATQGPTRLKASAMTVYLEKAGAAGGDRQVRRIEVKGPVTVVQNGKIGTGDAGLYDKTENKWYLIGNVTLTEGSDVTQGQKLIYDLATSTALVDAGRQGRVRSVFTPKDSGAKDSSAAEARTEVRPAERSGDAPRDIKPKLSAKRPDSAAARP